MRRPPPQAPQARGEGEAVSEAKARLQQENDYLRAQNARLWELLKVPGMEATRALADFPGIVASFRPPTAGEDYRVMRTWHRTIARALEDRVQEVIRGRR